MRAGVFIEIKRPFSWTSCSCGPSEREGVRKDPGVRGPWGLPRRLLCLSWEIRPVPLLTAQDPGTGRGPAQGPVATAESPERTRGAVGGPGPSQLEVSGCLGLPGAPAAADTEGGGPWPLTTSSSCAQPKNCSAASPEAPASASCQRLLPRRRHHQPQPLSAEAQGSRAIPWDSTLPLSFWGVSLHWEAGVLAWGVA